MNEHKTLKGNAKMNDNLARVTSLNAAEQEKKKTHNIHNLERIMTRNIKLAGIICMQNQDPVL